MRGLNLKHMARPWPTGEMERGERDNPKWGSESTAALRYFGMYIFSLEVTVDRYICLPSIDYLPVYLGRSLSRKSLKRVM